MKQNRKKCFLPFLAAALICITGCGNTIICYSSEETADSAPENDLPEADSPAYVDEKDAAFYEIYRPFGLFYDQEKSELYFNGELVRCFWDGLFLEEGISICRCNYFNENGCIDIHTLRETIDNGDGSIDPFGDLTGIEKNSRKEFEERDLSEFYRTDMMEATTDVSNHSFRLSDLFNQQKSFSDIFKKYEKLGITYTENTSGGSMGNVYYNGQLVNTFVDETNSGGVFSFHSADGGGINVQIAYDNRGNLTGVRLSPA